MIVIDTSAIIAILRNEEDAATMAACVVDAGAMAVSAASVLEASIVLSDKRFGVPTEGERLLDAFLATNGLTVEPVTIDQLALARAAFRRYGKGTGHGAGLNFGDCFAYALAKSLDVPLLYKGGDFARTDIANALA